MKSLHFAFYFAIFFAISLGISTSNFQEENKSVSLYSELIKVNEGWKTKADPTTLFEVVHFENDQQRLIAHFEQVKHYLINQSTAHLSEDMIAERLQHIENLTNYLERGIFPKNYAYEDRKPCFIDQHGTTCAVAQLLIDSDKSNLAYEIADKSLYAFVEEMNYDELSSWQAASGLTHEELMLIQPSYDFGPFIKSYPDTKNLLAFTFNNGFTSITGGKNEINPQNEFYKSHYANAFGLSYTRKLTKRLKATGGISYTNKAYQQNIDGNFGTQNEYGLMKVRYDLDYISLPFSITYSRANSRHGRQVGGFWRLGWEGQVLNGVKSNGRYYGAISQKEFDDLTRTKDDYRKFMHNVLIGYGKMFAISNRFKVNVEPTFTYAFSSDAKSASNDYKPYYLGINSSLNFNF